jgi:hypothetical protein
MERERPRFEGVMSWAHRVKIACGQIARVYRGMGEPAYETARIWHLTEA